MCSLREEVCLEFITSRYIHFWHVAGLLREISSTHMCAVQKVTQDKKQCFSRWIITSYGQK